MGVWEQILADHVPPNEDGSARTCLVLGDRSSGARSLLSLLMNVDKSEVTRGLGLAYSYTDVEYPEDSAAAGGLAGRINFWTLVSEELAETDLLSNALTPEVLPHAAAVVAIDFSRPWDLLEQAGRWLALLERTVASAMGGLEPAEAKKIEVRGRWPSGGARADLRAPPFPPSRARAPRTALD